MDAQTISNDFDEFLPYIDVADGLTRLQNSKKLYARLLKSYLSGTNNFDSMAQPLAAGEMETAREKVHSFKGVSANLSLTKNFEASRNLEAILKENGDYAPALAMLKESVSATEQQIQKLIPRLEA